MAMSVRTLACGFSLAASLGACAAEWICETNSPVKADFDYAKEFYQQDPLAARGTSCFAKRVVNAKAVVSARWTVTGLGVFEAYVNGEPVDAANPDRPRLMPGFTDMRKTRHAFTFDVTGQMRTAAGAVNVFAAEVTSGWWRDRIARFYGKRSAFYAELVLEYGDGTRETIGTDTSWRVGTASPVQTAAIFDGEDYDARIARGWMKTGEGPGFGPAVISTEFKGTVFPMEGPHVRWREDLVLRPVSVRAWSGVEGEAADRFGRIARVRTCDPTRPIRLAKGEHLVVDFGQNCAAVPRFVFEAARGTALRIQPREMLNDGEGLKSRGNDGPGGSVYLSNVRGARAEANYTFAGTGRERYVPAFTYFGYRYLALSATDEVVLHRLESVPVTSLAQAAEGGSLETGVPAVNRLVRNVLWGMRSNYLSVPTDCPQRNERLGWAADTQVFAPTATRFADVYGFLSKWMHDMRDTQMETGSYAAIAPFSEYDEDPDRFGWADAGIIVPHLLWQRTGNPTVVRDNWDSMTRMMARVSATRHELMPGCFQFADWLSFEKFQPCGIPRAQRLNPAPDCRRYWNFLGACYWLRDARMMREMAQAVGKPADAALYAQEAARALSHIRATYLDAAGRLDPAFADLQGANVFALAHGLFPHAAAKARGREALVRNIRAHGDCLQTGFLSTAFLLQALTEAGAADVAYTLLLQHRFPSWLYSVDQGATTIWERWNSYTVKDGFGPVSMNSFNHYAYGCVAEWLFATAAGIQPDPQIPGYRHFTLAPVLDARLGHVTARQRVPAGEIASAWRIEPDGSWMWTFTVPEGTTATAVRPDTGVRKEFSAGTHTLRGQRLVK